MPRTSLYGTARRAKLPFPGVAIAVVVVASLLSSGSGLERARPVGDDKPAVEWKKSERLLMDLVDRARARRGLRALNWRRTVGHVARRHSDRMRDQRTVYHGRLDRMLRDFDWEVAGEAVGCSPRVREAFRGFMQSDGHRHLILKAAFHRMGVGIEKRGERLYVTILFLD